MSGKTRKKRVAAAVLLVPALLLTAAVATENVSLSSKFGLAACIALGYLAIVALTAAIKDFG